MMSILLKMFIISLLLNIIWESIHSRYYKTCMRMPLKKLIPWIFIASVMDAFLIIIIYFLSIIIFGSINIILNMSQLLFFIFIMIIISFFIEKIALQINLWDYSPRMRLFVGVGVSPLVQLTVTGILTLLLLRFLSIL
jgi:hypothetical protein